MKYVAAEVLCKNMGRYNSYYLIITIFNIVFFANCQYALETNNNADESVSTYTIYLLTLHFILSNFKRYFGNLIVHGYVVSSKVK